MVEILHAEFEDALAESSADWKKSGRILKIVLFGSYARGDWIDEPLTMKGYRISICWSSSTTHFTYWYKAKDRLDRDRAIKTPTDFIVHSRRFVNTALRQGQYFFADIRRDGVVHYELDEEPLAEPKPQSSVDALKFALEHFDSRMPMSTNFHRLSAMALSNGHGEGKRLPASPIHRTRLFDTSVGA